MTDETQKRFPGFEDESREVLRYIGVPNKDYVPILTLSGVMPSLIHVLEGSKAEVSVVIDGVSIKFTARLNKDGNFEYVNSEKASPTEKQG